MTCSDLSHCQFESDCSKSDHPTTMNYYHDAQVDTRARLLSESSAASDRSEGSKRERQLQILHLTKQKLELALELQSLQRKNATRGKCAAPHLSHNSTVGREPAPAVASSECDGRPFERVECTPLEVISEWIMFEEDLEKPDNLSSIAPTRHTSGVDLDESFWNSPSPPRRGPLLSSAKRNLLKSEHGPDSFQRTGASLVRHHSLPCETLGNIKPSEALLQRMQSSFKDLLARGRTEVSPPDLKTQIPPALLAVMKRKGKLHLVQGLSVA